MKTLMIKKSVAIAALAFCVPFTAQASSDSVDSVTVEYAGIDTTHIQGQDQLYKKLKHAAAKVCGSTNMREVGSVRRVTENKRCAKEALGRALEQVGIEAVNELHLSQR